LSRTGAFDSLRDGLAKVSARQLEMGVQGTNPAVRGSSVPGFQQIALARPAGDSSLNTTIGE